MVCGFAAGLDATSTFIVFPAIRDDLASGDTASATWVLTITGIVSAAILLQAGRLADRFGHNRILVVSAFTTTLASMLAAVAPTLELLVAARGLQAAALAGLGVSSIAIIVRETPVSKLAGALGLWGFWTATSGVVGPTLAAGYVEISSWRWIFATAAPIGLVIAWLAAPGWVSNHVPKRGGAIDYVGTALAMGGLSLLVFALLEGNDWGWASGRTVGSIGVGALLIALVVLRSRVHPDPIVPLHLFSNTGYVLSLAIGFIANIGFFGMWLALLSYATDVWDYSLISTGLLLTLMPGTMALMARGAGRFADANGFRGVMAPGAAVFTIGFAIAALTVDATPQAALLLPAVVAAGIGMATVLPSVTTVGTRTLDPRFIGTGTAIMQTTHRIGGALGSAIVVALLETGQIGDPATHRRSLWMIVVAGALVTGLSLTLTPKRIGPPHRVDSPAVF